MLGCDNEFVCKSDTTTEPLRGSMYEGAVSVSLR